jgi:hypothetical protein
MHEISQRYNRLPTWEQIEEALGFLYLTNEQSLSEIRANKDEDPKGAQVRALVNEDRRLARAAQLMANLKAEGWTLSSVGGRILLPSSSRRGAQPYFCIENACSCEGGMKGQECHHMTAVKAIDLAMALRDMRAESDTQINDTTEHDEPITIDL